jgi:Domain of unknown function (DUF4136)
VTVSFAIILYYCHSRKKFNVSREKMIKGRCLFLASLMVVVLTAFSVAQKVKIGYDKSADFSKYKTYTWAKPDHPVENPQLFQSVVGTIDQDLQAKGLTRVPENGDLNLSASGGLDFGYNERPTAEMDPVMWQGQFGAPVLGASLVAQGTLTLHFVDRSKNKLVWQGTAMQKLDPEQKNQDLVLAEKAVDKLLKGFPPKH